MTTSHFLITHLAGSVHQMAHTVAAATPVGGDCKKPGDPSVSLGDAITSFVGSLPIIGGAAKGADMAIHILGWLLELVTDIPKFFHDLLQWIVNLVFPAELQTWFGGTISGQTTYINCAGKPIVNEQDIYRSLFNASSTFGIMLAAVCAAIRVVRLMFDQRVSGMVLFVDVLPRFFVALVLTQGLGLAIMVWMVNASVLLANGVTTAFLSGSGFDGDLIKLLISKILIPTDFTVFLVFTGIPLIVMLFYLMCLMIVRTIMIGFCIATAPLCIATAAFDHKNKFFQWWSEMFVGALMLPLVLGASIAVSLRLAISIGRAPFIGPILAGIVMCGGIWFVGKAVHQLTWRHFSHGGPIGAITAGMAAAFALPAAAGKLGAVAQSMAGDKLPDWANKAATKLGDISYASQMGVGPQRQRERATGGGGGGGGGGGAAGGLGTVGEGSLAGYDANQQATGAQAAALQGQTGQQLAGEINNGGLNAVLDNSAPGSDAGRQAVMAHAASKGGGNLSYGQKKDLFMQGMMADNPDWTRSMTNQLVSDTMSNPEGSQGAFANPSPALQAMFAEVTPSGDGSGSGPSGSGSSGSGSPSYQTVPFAGTHATLLGEPQGPAAGPSSAPPPMYTPPSYASQPAGPGPEAAPAPEAAPGSWPLSGPYRSSDADTGGV